MDEITARLLALMACKRKKPYRRTDFILMAISILSAIVAFVVRTLEVQLGEEFGQGAASASCTIAIIAFVFALFFLFATVGKSSCEETPLDPYCTPEIYIAADDWNI